MFLSSFFVGRLFCGWVCPAAGLQRLCMKANCKRFKLGWRDWIKYIFWVPWVSTIAFMLFHAGGIKSINLLYQTYYGESVQDVGSLMLFLMIAGGIGVVAIITGRRGFCHSLCWMAPFMIIGREIRNRGNWPSLQLTADQEECIDCMNCSKNCPMTIDVHGMVENGYIENSECILCGTCIAVCPSKVISYSF